MIEYNQDIYDDAAQNSIWLQQKKRKTIKGEIEYMGPERKPRKWVWYQYQRYQGLDQLWWNRKYWDGQEVYVDCTWDHTKLTGMNKH